MREVSMLVGLLVYVEDASGAGRFDEESRRAAWSSPTGTRATRARYGEWAKRIGSSSNISNPSGLAERYHCRLGQQPLWASGSKICDGRRSESN